jgi:hypothetical protein
MSEHAAGMVLEHARQLVATGLLRIDSADGLKPVATFRAEERVATTEEGELLVVEFYGRRMFFLAAHTARLAVLVRTADQRLTPGELAKLVQQMSHGSKATTAVIASLAGIQPEAREMADRRAGRTTILMQPNSAGGWEVLGPQELRATADAFDPEGPESKANRVAIAARAILGNSGQVTAFELEQVTALPPHTVEDALRSFAKSNGSVALKRREGRMILVQSAT